MLKLIILLLISLFSFSIAQGDKAENVWEPFKYFVGSWIGEESGKAGSGKGERQYNFILDDKFLHHQNKSVFGPQEKNPDGEVHQDWAFYSYDKIKNKYKLRQFNSEGYVNQYILDSLSADKKTIVFVSEAIENVPEGWRAKITIMIQNEDEFLETFDLAAPGKEFSRMLENHWRRGQ